MGGKKKIVLNPKQISSSTLLLRLVYDRPKASSPPNSTAIRLAHQPLSLQPPQSPIKASPPAARLK